MCVQVNAGVQTHGWAVSWRIQGVYFLYSKHIGDLQYEKCISSHVAKNSKINQVVGTSTVISHRDPCLNVFIF